MGNFARYEKFIAKNFKVSLDILFESVLDRQTGVSFDAEWIFGHSSKQRLKGKTIAEELAVKIIGIDALIVMKFISARATDIRDVFMLALHAKDRQFIKKEIATRYDFQNRLMKINDTINDKKFKDNLQGVYGFVDEKLFERHINAILDFDQ